MDKDAGAPAGARRIIDQQTARIFGAVAHRFDVCGRPNYTARGDPVVGRIAHVIDTDDVARDLQITRSRRGREAEAAAYVEEAGRCTLVALAPLRLAGKCKLPEG